MPITHPVTLVPWSLAKFFEAAHIGCWLLEALMGWVQLATDGLPGSTTYGQGAVVHRKACAEQHAATRGALASWLADNLTSDRSL